MEMQETRNSFIFIYLFLIFFQNSNNNIRLQTVTWAIIDQIEKFILYFFNAFIIV
jgi:hypothetical protein